LLLRHPCLALLHLNDARADEAVNGLAHVEGAAAEVGRELTNVALSLPGLKRR
jgi:hypothetical protein